MEISAPHHVGQRGGATFTCPSCAGRRIELRLDQPTAYPRAIGQHRTQHHLIALGQAGTHLGRTQGAQAQPHVTLLDAPVLHHPQRGTRGVGTHGERRDRDHQRTRATPCLDLDRQGHVFAQESGRIAHQRELDLDRAPLRIHRGGNRQHAGGKTAPRIGICQHRRGLLQCQLVEKTLIDLGAEPGRPLQRQRQQSLARLHDLSGLDLAQQHLGIGRRAQACLRQPGLCGGNAGICQLQLRLRLHDIGARVRYRLHLRSGRFELRGGDITRAAGIVEPRCTEKLLRHQLLHPLELGLRRGDCRLCLAQSLLGLPGGASSLDLALRDVWTAKDLAGELRQQYPYKIESWQETNAQLVSALNAQSVSTGLIRLIVLLVVVLGIASVLVVSVVQKRREIGILRAMGATRGQMVRVFLVQGGIVGAVGSILGLGLALLMIYLFALFVRGSDGQPLFAIVLPMSLALQVALTASACGVLAAIAPARRAAAMDPAQAIRI